MECQDRSGTAIESLRLGSGYLVAGYGKRHAETAAQITVQIMPHYQLIRHPSLRWLEEWPHKFPVLGDPPRIC